MSTTTMGDRVRERRTKLNITQKQLAQRAGVSRSSIANLEAGIRETNRSSLRLATILKTNVRWLETGDGDEDETEPGTALPIQLVENVGTAHWDDDEECRTFSPTLGPQKYLDIQIANHPTQAILVIGSGLSPRVKDHEFILFSCHRPPVSGDEVLIQLKTMDTQKPSTKLLVKQFLFERNGILHFGPIAGNAKIVQIERSAIYSLSSVVGIVPEWLSNIDLGH